MNCTGGIGPTADSSSSVGAGGMTGTSATSSSALDGSGGLSTSSASGTSVGGASGAGGSPTGTNGSVSDCSVPYAGPVGGPREGGPEPLNTLCENISDDVILARYKDFSQKVPQGLYWEPPGVVSIWEEPCSESEQETLDRASMTSLGEPAGSLSSQWSYEANGCVDGTRRIYSNLRCDYFDGETISNGSIEDLAYLASLLWWMENGNIAGYQLLGYTGLIGDATDRIDMCSIRTTFGDFGLCDEITLEVTSYRMLVGTTVTVDEPMTLRTIQGTCN